MPEYILANTDFALDTNSWFPKNPLSLQLSFLSFCLGETHDIALIPYDIDQSYKNRLSNLSLPIKNYELLDRTPKNAIINSWKVTEQCEKIAQTYTASLKYPYHVLQKELASKAFALTIHMPKFQSKLIQSQDEFFHFMNHESGLFVLKEEYGLSGQGHHFFHSPLKPELQIKKPINFMNARLEKWVNRVFDFSTQWLLDEHVNFLGACELFNHKKGSYSGSRFPIQNKLYDSFVDEHITFVKPFLDAFYEQGYRGHLGIDAFVYVENNELLLCPLIEINPRKTMGFVAWKLSQHFEKCCEIQVGDFCEKTSLLPLRLQTKNSVASFKKNINLSFL